MLVVNRFRVPEDDAAGFREDLEAALALLAQQRGYADGRLGRNVDDPTLWVMVTRWKDVGSYRRGLSWYDVKVGAVPLLSWAIKAGNLPNLGRWLREGSHAMTTWHTGVPSTTPASQAGILHGKNDFIPAFRWWEKDQERMLVSNHPEDAAEIVSTIECM